MQLLVDITLFFLLSIIYNLVSSCLLGTKFIPIKVGIVRLGITNIHTKSVTLFHHLYDMTHHRHSMKGWLSIEKDNIAIHHMTVYNVTIF